MSDVLTCFLTFQEQLRRRREEEDRIAQQNEFLRNSVRGSRKLQSLQDGTLSEPRPVGIENDAFTEDEDLDNITGKSKSECYIWQMKKKSVIWFIELNQPLFLNTQCHCQLNEHFEMHFRMLVAVFQWEEDIRFDPRTHRLNSNSVANNLFDARVIERKRMCVIV